MTTVQTEIEAYAFRQLVAHLRARTDVQNIDQMNLAGFCRNCLSKWYLRGARERGLAMSYDDALEVVYGEPYGTRETAPAKPASAPPADSTFAPTRPPPRSPWAHTPFAFPTSTTPGDWKKKHQTKATPEQMALFEANAHLHAKHPKLDDPPPPSSAPASKPAPAPAAAPATAAGGLSDVCCTPEDEISPASCAPGGVAPAADSNLPADATETVTTPPPTPGAAIGLALRVGILTVSDRAHARVYEDESGPAVRLAMLAHAEATDAFHVFSTLRYIVPDEKALIEARIKAMTAAGCNLVLTTGGTGCAPRDVTPEATAGVLHRMIPGIPAAMLRASLERQPHAALSRAVAGVRDRTLVINLPGRPQAARDTLAAIIGIVPHAVRQIAGE